MRYAYLVAIAIVVSLSGVSRAGLTYQFVYSPSASQVNAGPQSIDLFLQQTGDASGETTLHLVDVGGQPGGLSTANFTLFSNGNPVSFTSATTGFVDDSLLTFASADLTTAGQVLFSQTSLDPIPTFANGLLGFSVSDTVSRIKIGSVNFNLAFGETTTLSIGSTDFALGNGFNTFSITDPTLTLTAVPEPGAFLLMGITVAGGAAFLRRRKAATQPAAPAKE
jgi:hypothetical protein